jgi:uncharacterized iron-regulated membrane protein
MAGSRARSVKFWSGVHRWTSIICTLFILMLCITGLPLIFADEIDDWVYHTAHSSSASNEPSLTLDELADVAKKRFPGQFIQFLFWHPTIPHAVSFGLSPTLRGTTPVGLHTLVIDSLSGKIIEDAKPRRGITFYLLKIHTDMFLGLPGGLFLGAMGLILLASLVTGVVLYGPFVRHLDFGEIRASRRSRIRWLDLHNLLGIATVTWLFVVGAAGAMNTLAAPLFDLWRAKELPVLVKQQSTGKPPETLTSIDEAIAAARRESPDMQLISVVFPYSALTTPRHYMIWTKGRAPVTAHLFSPVMVDAETGEFVGILRLPWYIRVLEISRPIHFGNYGGLPLKLLWAFLDLITIIVLTTGVYLWLRKMRVTRRISEPLLADTAVAAKSDFVVQKTSRRKKHTFRWPTIIGLITAVGLGAALLGDGAWDVMSWVMLSLPTAVALMGLWRLFA